MGYYINTPEHKQKANQLVCIYNARIIDQPQAFSQTPEDKILICVVQNEAFDAALVCVEERDFLRAKDTRDDYRPRTWLTMDKRLAMKLIGKGE